MKPFKRVSFAPAALGVVLSVLPVSSAAFAQQAPGTSPVTENAAKPKPRPASTQKETEPVRQPKLAEPDEPEPAQTPAPRLPPLAAEERAALISGLMQERLYWTSRNTGLTAPVLATVAGIIATSVGAGLVSGGNDDHNRGMINAGIGSTITGLVSFVTGIALFCYRTSDAHQAEEIEKIDRKLDTLGIPARITPWLSAGSQVSAGLSLSMKL